MNCGDIGPLISAYYDGEATPDERRQVEYCIEHDPQAAALLESYRELSGDLQTLGRPLPPTQLRRSVMNAIHTAGGADPVYTRADAPTASNRRLTDSNRTATGSYREPLTPRRAFGNLFRSLAFSAVVLLLAVSAIFLFNRPTTPTGLAAQQTATAVAVFSQSQTALAYVPSATNTPPPTDTPFALATATTLVLDGQPTLTPLPPTSTPEPPTLTPLPTDTPLATATLVPPSNTPAPTHTAKPAPSSTPQIIYVPVTNTPAPSPPTATTQPPTATAPPSSTPLLPTLTPPPSSTPSPTGTATRTPRPTFTPTTTPPLPTLTPACAFQPKRGFGLLYNQSKPLRDKVGCALNDEVGRNVTYLEMQNGFMIWEQDSRLIYVFYSNYNAQGSRFEVYTDTYRDGDAEPVLDIIPTTGSFIPRRGFGKLWAADPTLRQQIGYAMTENEQPLLEARERFTRARMIWLNTSPAYIYVLYGSPDGLEGTWERYVDQFRDPLASPTP